MGTLGLLPEGTVTGPPSSTVAKNAYTCSYTASAVRIKIGVQVTSTLTDGLVRRQQRKFDHRFTLPGVENLREVCTEGKEGVRIYGEAHCVYSWESKKIRFSCTKLFTIR
jgi:hypothetical protein